MSIAKPLSGIRLAATRAGDTLQAIAARELGDAARWYDLVAVNNLLPPWITDDPAQVGPRVIQAGADILIPAAAPEASGVAAGPDDAVFGTDMTLPGGFLQAGAGGDFDLLTGAKNLTQAVAHRLATPERSVIYHQDYGCAIHDLVGARADPVADSLGALFVERALRADPRISQVENTTATITGDVLDVTATAVAVDGRRLPVRTI
jgi:phage baseplate assembly protein W